MLPRGLCRQRGLPPSSLPCRYWNQLNEDLRILLERFDSETSDEAEVRNEAEATTSFLGMLLHWDREELEEKLAQRVQVSTRAVAKVLQAFDRLVQRNHKVMRALQGGRPNPGTRAPPLLESRLAGVGGQFQGPAPLESSAANYHHVWGPLSEATNQSWGRSCMFTADQSYARASFAVSEMLLLKVFLQNKGKAHTLRSVTAALVAWLPLMFATPNTRMSYVGFEVWNRARVSDQCVSSPVPPVRRSMSAAAGNAKGCCS